MSGSSPNSFLYDLVNLTEIPTKTIVVQPPSDNEFVFDFSALPAEFIPILLNKFFATLNVK